MRSVVLGLVATVAVAVLAPIAVMSAPKVAPPAVTEAARKQGMAEAPALAKAAGIGCQVADARFIGKVDNKKEKISTAFYEIDCAQGLGFVVQSINNGTKPSAFTCIEANTPLADGKPPTIPCLLPGNGDPKSDLAPLIAKSGTACVPELVRGIGQSVSSTFIEVACQGGAGLVLQAANPAEADKPVIANNCLDFDESGSNIKCTLHDKAYRLGVVDGLIKASNNGCTLKDRRYIGASTTGATFFEAACTDGKGYILKVDKGALASTIACEKASQVMGGCQLTDAREAETAQAGLYTKLAKSANFDCAVTKYAPFPSPANKDVVEMACSNRPDGGVGVFGGPNDKPMVYDCARAPMVGYRCSFTKPEVSFPLVTADLKKQGKNECVVSAVRFIGKTTKGTTYLETACADGLKGYILEYVPETLTPVGVIGCAFSKDCKLPGNT